MKNSFESENLILILLYGIFSVTGNNFLDTMIEPICQAKCLKLYKDAMKNSGNAENIFKNPFLIQSYCLKNSYCKGCMIGCSNSAQSMENCQNNCKNHANKFQNSCLLSCGFVNEKKIDKPGVCPEVTQKSQCSNQCNKDSDCFKQGTKCCKNRYCNFTCQISDYPKLGVPPVPSPPIVRQIINDKNPDQIQFDLDWSSYNISLIDYPVLFVVQFRIGQLNIDNYMPLDRWRNLVTTSKSGAIISAIDPETSYQFRLLAFSEYGFKGVGQVTLPITVQYKPTNPASPKNVLEKVTRIYNGKISVTITWQPGDSNSLLPLSNYKISWKRVYEFNENNPLVTEYELFVPATETQYTIENLLPSASYMVKIVSVVAYKNEKYSSVPTVYYISTASVPSQKSNEEKIIHFKEDDAKCACGYSNKHLPIDIKNASMVNEQLAIKIQLKNKIQFDNNFAPYSFRIRWRPIACIESQFNNNISPVIDDWQTILVQNRIENYLTNLRFHCNYQLEIELFSQMARKIIKIWEGCFCTPSCNAHFSLTGNIQSPCSSSDLYNPPLIQHLKVILKRSANNSNADAELYWNIEPKSHVTAFRITWGPRMEEPIDGAFYGKDFMPLLDAGKALSKVVNYPIHQSTLKDLNAGKIYIVKLQAIDENSASLESSIFFKIHSDTNSKSNERLLTYFVICIASLVCFNHI